MYNFRHLEVWELAMQVAEQVYVVTTRFPPSERFGLTQQMRRSAVSISSNIAEGAARSTAPDFRRFLSIAKGSASELDSQLELATRLGYLVAPDVAGIRNNIDRVRAMIEGLRRSL